MIALLCLSLALVTDPDTTALQDPVPSTSVVAQAEETVIDPIKQAGPASAIEQAALLNEQLAEILNRVEQMQIPVATTEAVPVERLEAPATTQ